MLAPLAGELTELHEEDAAVFGEGRMAEAGGVQKEGARGIVAMLVGEHAVEHQDFLSLRMAVRAKSRRGVIAHDGGDPAELAIDEVKAHAPSSGDRAEERRGGEERDKMCRARWWRKYEKNKK